MITHINVLNCAQGEDCYCLCGYTFLVVEDENRSIHKDWIRNNDDSGKTDWKNDAGDTIQVTCKICLDKYPLVLLAEVDLE